MIRRQKVRDKKGEDSLARRIILDDFQQSGKIDDDDWARDGREKMAAE